eukprot:scaffold2660_cov116-Skeletonema_dohrnii-CCMP3373.AAC.5
MSLATNSASYQEIAIKFRQSSTPPRWYYITIQGAREMIEKCMHLASLFSHAVRPRTPVPGYLART